MKIGMIVDEKGYGRFGDDKYKKLKEHGYDCADFDMSNTETPLYGASEEEAHLMLQKEKQLAKEMPFLPEETVRQFFSLWDTNNSERIYDMIQNGD